MTAQASELLLVFGPQALSFEDADFQALRTKIFSSEEYKWMLDVVLELPECLQKAVATCPAISNISRSWINLIEEFQQSFISGKQVLDSTDLPNFLLSPLVVLLQLVQYVEYRKKLDPNDLYSQSLNVTTLGFCTGQLSALAISTARDSHTFANSGAAAVRLALVAGLVVDIQDSIDPAKSLAIIWHSETEKLKLHDALETQKAYMSVCYDENRATVTTSSSNATDLRARLREAGITVTDISLRGRYHWEGHIQAFKALQRYVSENSEFCFPSSRLVTPTRYIDDESKELLQVQAMRSILLEPFKWYNIFSAAHKDLLQDSNSQIISFGLERCIPPSFLRGLIHRVKHIADSSATPADSNENKIAVIGMSCKVAGADDLDELWDLLCAGKSQHKEVPAERFSFETVHREQDDRKWYGNFMNNHDAFDHKFFKKTPRESVSMDPQQRQLLQIAYQAVEQSGYFHRSKQDPRIGCFVGVCSTDYEDNIACHAPTAYSATGHLRGFIAGKVSHFFGWTGPGLTIDTACSSSAVAVHQACRAILNDECTAAVAGGSHVMSSPLWYQNLAGASFLSKTGACKPFDADADGYCRGEGVAAVFLKKLSSAIADGDQIYGVIAGTAVQQNENCTPIVVPNVPSLSGLFQNVLAKANVRPEDVSVVEAHGTGTPVGDPAEFESVRKVFSTPKRAGHLALGSVKGLIGHCECTSGIVSLIKILLMINRGIVPPQASFNTINPAIQRLDGIEIPRECRKWEAEFRAALINNYGASGSNASMVVTQAPQSHHKEAPISVTEHPLCFSGLDDRSISAYAQRLRRYVQRHGDAISVRALASSLARQSNRSLERHLIFSCRSIDELLRKLDGTPQSLPQQRPLIMCFGGQVSKFVGLDRQIYEQCSLLRHGLDECDQQCIQLGVGSIYPDIFQRTPIEDSMKLQTCLFALQYACATAWIASGLQPVAVVGHSFGELSSLCIAGILSLKHAIKMIATRARIIRDFWPGDRGAMIAVEGDEGALQQVMKDANQAYQGAYPSSIACYNGPTSFTVAGSSEVMEKVAENLQHRSMKHKRLNVTHAFHSTLVDPLTEMIESELSGLEFLPATMHVAFCAEELPSMTPAYFAKHLRNPVYFSKSIQRLSKQFPEAVWLEAGSNSTITNMVHRTVAATNNHFQAVNITCDNAWSSLSETAMSLWRAGVDARFWGHYSQEASTPLQLPPYQFELTKHWLELKAPPKLATISHAPVSEALMTFVGYQDKRQDSARFRVNTTHARYQELMTGHVVAYTAPILPATVQIDLAVESLLTLLSTEASIQPQILNVQNDAAICNNTTLDIWLDLERDGSQWNFRFTSNAQDSKVQTLHTRGVIALILVEDPGLNLEFERYGRLIGHPRCQALLNDTSANNVMQGRSIYKTFSEVVNYDTQYQGLQKIVGNDFESAGHIVKQYTGKTWFDAHLSDTFCQIIGIWVNYMTDRETSNICIAKGFEKWARSPKLSRTASRPDAYDVLACHQKSTDGTYVSDLFVFDPTTGELLEFILGFRFITIAKASLIKILARLTSGLASQEVPIKPTKQAAAAPTKVAIKASSPAKTVRNEVLQKLKVIIVELSGVDEAKIAEDTELADIGIDSLMGMELVSEFERCFKCSLPEDEISVVTDVAGTLKCLLGALNLDDGADQDDGLSTSGETDASEPESDSTPLSTPDHEYDLPEQKTCIPPSQPAKPTELFLSPGMIIKAFDETCELTDQFIADSGCADYVGTVLPEQNALCTALTIEAFAQLGASIKTAGTGDRVELFTPLPQHAQLVRNLCEMLERTAGLVKIEDDAIIRTSTPLPRISGEDFLRTMNQNHSKVNQLIYYVGSQFADVLRGKIDGVKLIFGRAEGRELVSSLYGDWIMNRPFYKQMEDFLTRLVARLPKDEGPLKILEMGAGTGGTTKWLVPLLARLNYPVEYTFTDLSPSFVAAARKTFKQYPFMKFAAHDIEKEVAPELREQHMIIASNAVHATHSLVRSAGNIRQALKPNGILMMLEMIEPLYWVDMIFGLFEGWWFFDDGRKHALTPTSRWKADLGTSGFGHVSWTHGSRPEAEINKVIVAVACDGQVSNDPTRQDLIDGYVSHYTRDFHAPETKLAAVRGDCVMVTGATGSTGSHLVAELARQASVRKVVCLNRRSQQDPLSRQREALDSRGIELSANELAKLDVLEADTSKPLLGLPDAVHQRLAREVTHIIHNAWPMSIKRPVKGFEGQFQAMRNLIDLAREAAADHKVHFLFVSSIAAVGAYPTWQGTPIVPEERMPLEAVMPIGYAEAKHVCERMLDETLHRYPARFCTTSVRLGQIAGSSRSGYWNTTEHLPFLWKSAQALAALPALSGPLSWTPVDQVAAALVDLACHPSPYPVYHVDNPTRQTWEEMLPTIAGALAISPNDIIPFDQWVMRLRENSAGQVASPAAQLADFLDRDFRRMSCGGLLLSTSNAVEHSPHLKAVGCVSVETTLKFFEYWRRTRFLV